MHLTRASKRSKRVRASCIYTSWCNTQYVIRDTSYAVRGTRYAGKGFAESECQAKKYAQKGNFNSWGIFWYCGLEDLEFFKAYPVYNRPEKVVS